MPEPKSNSNGSVWWWQPTPEPTHCIPADWFHALPEYMSWTSLTRSYRSREEAIRAAVAAFDLLPPERQEELRPLAEQLRQSLDGVSQ